MKAIELFAGAGGLGIGVSRAGFSPAAIVEWDRWCCDTIRENRKLKRSALAAWPEPIEADVRSVDFRKFEGRVELISGGPPCQPFSLGGKHRAHEDARDMWPEAVRVLREVKPHAFLFENVKGLTRASFASYLAYIVHQLSYPELIRKKNENWDEHLCRLERHHTGRKDSSGEFSYRVVFRVLNAADYGVPQRRERVVFVGFRKDLGIEWSFPDPTHSRQALVCDQSKFGEYWDRHQVPRKHRRETNVSSESMFLFHGRQDLKPWRTVRDAIADLPDPEFDLGHLEKSSNLAMKE